MTTKDMSFIELHQLIGRKTGGISIDAMVLDVRCKEDPCGHILIRGKAMAGRAKHLFQLIFFFFFFQLTIVCMICLHFPTHYKVIICFL